jgi:aminoglycoside 6'-N-acetyltransferase I
LLPGLGIKPDTLSVVIEQCTVVEQEGWLRLRQELWPHCSREQHLSEMLSFCAQPERFAQFVAYTGSGQGVGFVEVAVRTDYVNGTDTSPVAFLEGIYVVPEARRTGIARALVATAERWASNRGCRELASDAALENKTSHAVHRALGFHETERVVFFRKLLT